MKFLRIIAIIVCFWFSANSTNAQTWGTIKRLTWNSGDSNNPCAVHVSGNLICLVWDDGSPGNQEIYFKKSTDAGATWSALKRLTWNSGGSRHPRISSSPSGVLHVVWKDDNSGVDEIYYKRSVNSGNTWSSARRLTWISDNSRMPVVASDSINDIYVFYYNSVAFTSDIYYKKSMDNGLTWGAVSRFTWTDTNNTHPEIILTPADFIHVVWFDGGTLKEIYHKRSTDDGSSWSAIHRLTWNTGNSYSVVAALDSSNNLHVVYVDNSSGNTEVYYKKSTNNGNNWSAATRMTWTSYSSTWPTITVDSTNRLHVVWCESNITGYDLYYKNSTNGGTSWSTRQRLTWNDGWSIDAKLMSDSSGAVHLVWSDDVTYKSEIYYRKWE